MSLTEDIQEEEEAEGVIALAMAVVDAAVAYCDQLCAFNILTHPEVHRRRLELAKAVDAWHHRGCEGGETPPPGLCANGGLNSTS